MKGNYMEDISSLDFESVVSDEVAEEYREDYEKNIEIVKCWSGLTLKEYAYCMLNNINECDLIQAKHGNNYCRNCNSQTFVTNSSIPVLMVGIIIIILLVLREYIMNNSEDFINILNYILGQKISLRI